MVWTSGWTFDMSRNSHLQSFQEFIDFVRMSLGTEGTVMHGALRLPASDPNGNPPLQELTLYARQDDGTLVDVTLLLRTDTLYAVAFRNTDGQWFRFADTGDIPGIDSVELHLSGSYVAANGIGPLRDTVPWSRPIIGTAILGLAAYRGGNNRSLSTWLRTLIVSFVESSRFTTVAGVVATAMAGGEQNLTSQHTAQIHNWGRLSTAVVQAANNVVQDPNTNIFRGFQHCGIGNAYTAAAALGLVRIINRATPRRLPRSLPDYDDVALGMTLLEVVSVVIRNIDGEDPGDLFDTVCAHDSLGTVYLFDRDRSDIQLVRPGDRAELVWPDRAISAADDFVIDLDLKDRDRIFSSDDEVSRGQVAWISSEARSSNCNVVRMTEVAGKYGLAQVSYAVLTNAVVATVGVLLVDGDGERVPDVFGTITATTNMSSGESLEYDLFRREDRSDQISVPANTDIPLRRRVITALLDSPLKVEVNLKDKDVLPDISSDDQIAQGSVDFQPRFQGRDELDITGPYGRVTVHVTWSVTIE